MPDRWYIAINGTEVGPMTLQDLKATLATFANAKDMLVWRDGLADWKPVRDLPEVRSQTAPPPPLSPAPSVPPAPSVQREAMRSRLSVLSDIRAPPGARDNETAPRPTLPCNLAPTTFVVNKGPTREQSMITHHVARITNPLQRAIDVADKARISAIVSGDTATLIAANICLQRLEPLLDRIAFAETGPFTAN
jgi:hypothetical protein